jgi:RNA polymerase sigma-70 factor (ECF subfamily)
MPSKRAYDKTAMGGTEEAFHTTRWTQIQQLQNSTYEHNQLLIEQLLQRYWKPVYCHLRYKGHSNETAKDLTQGFFYEIVLGKDLISKAEQSKGKFRTYLLTALDRYVSTVHRNENRQKRSPGRHMVSLDTESIEHISIPESQGSVDMFNYAWACEVLDEVIAKLQQEYTEGGKSAHWYVFRDRILQPILNGTTPPSLGELCEQYGIQDEPKASNMLITVKRRFRSLLKSQLGQNVSTDDEAEEEYHDLLQILASPRAG